MLLLSRNLDSENDESYMVLRNGRDVGRIFLPARALLKIVRGSGASNYTSGKDARGRSTATLHIESGDGGIQGDGPVRVRVPCPDFAVRHAAPSLINSL